MTRRQKKTLVRIVVSLALLGVCMVLPLKGIWKAAAFLIPYALCGWDVLWDAARNIAHGQVFDEQFLMALATLGALVMGDYAEAVAIMVFYQVGEWFQGIAVGKTRKSIAALMNIRPDTATVVRAEGEVTVEPEEVAAGEEIVIRPGERVPLDGVILEGFTAVNTAALTGESLPVDRGVGERVLSGSVNLTGVIRVKTDGTYGESTVSRILELAENASERKSRAENFITRFARVYTPCVVAGAVLVAIVPVLCFGGDWGKWIRSALSFLIVSCPCALVVSVPLSFFGGLGGASREGILMKGANDLEAMANATVAVFDKTGTLTCGTFAVSEVNEAGGTKEEILRLAAGAESRSSHPIARSVVEAYGQAVTAEEITEKAGRGIQAVVDGKRVWAGNRRLMNENGLEVPDDASAGTVVHVAADGKYLGNILVSDRLKDGAEAAVKGLKEAGIEKTVLLTGDSTGAAQDAAQKLGVDEVYAEQMPADKVKHVEELKADGAKVIFIGDGINDAPVLALADVGVAMGALGSDAAIEAADVVLMDDKPQKVLRAIRIARRTMRIVRQNVFLALGVKAVILLLAAFGISNMWLAVFADVGVLVLATVNAMRTLRTKGKV